MTCPFCGVEAERESVGRTAMPVVVCLACNVVVRGMPDNVGKWTRHPQFGDPWRSDRNRLGATRSAT